MASNSSISLLFISSTPALHIILNIVSFVATIIGTLLSFVMLTRVLLRKKTLYNVRLLLCTNNCILVFFLGIFELMDNVNIIRADFHISVTDEETVGCRIQAYIVFSLTSAVYLACVLQAVYCLCRIVYSGVVWLIEARTYLTIIPLSWVMSFVLISPLYVWHGHKLIPGEYICRITKDDPLSITYATVVVYGMPFSILTYIYFRIHQFLRQQAKSRIVTFNSKFGCKNRDIVVFRRIITIVTLLGSYGMPNSIMLIMLAVKHELVSSFYRILQLSFATIVFTLSLALFYINPNLRKETDLLLQER